MAHHLSNDEKQFVKLVEKLSISDDIRQTWLESIQTNGMTEDLSEQIHQFLSTVPEGEDDASKMNRGRHLIEFTTLVKRWRLSDQSKHFGRR